MWDRLPACRSISYASGSFFILQAVDRKLDPVIPVSMLKNMRGNPISAVRSQKNAVMSRFAIVICVIPFLVFGAIMAAAFPVHSAIERILMQPPARQRRIRRGFCDPDFIASGPRRVEQDVFSVPFYNIGALEADAVSLPVPRAGTGDGRYDLLRPSCQPGVLQIDFRTYDPAGKQVYPAVFVSK